MLGLIGGSGMQQLHGMTRAQETVVNTPYGAPSAALTFGEFAGVPLVFLNRHGRGHALPPHRINYRANMEALKTAGVSRIVAVAAVGGITSAMRPGRLAFPSQIIDYTWGRAQSFFDGDGAPVTHVDFTEPYCEATRRTLIDAATRTSVDAAMDGVYGATQGPRLETAAEIDRMARDGCDIVGMTGMPEAALAREAGLRYACCAVVANWAAGRGEGPITMDAIAATLERGMAEVVRLLAVALPVLAAA